MSLLHSYLIFLSCKIMLTQFFLSSSFSFLLLLLDDFLFCFVFFLISLKEKTNIWLPEWISVHQFQTPGHPRRVRWRDNPLQRGGSCSAVGAHVWNPDKQKVSLARTALSWNKDMQRNLLHKEAGSTRSFFQPHRNLSEDKENAWFGLETILSMAECYS